MHDHSLAIVERLLGDVAKRNPGRLAPGRLPAPTVLDVGSRDAGNGTYRSLVQPRGWLFLGLDAAPGPSVDVVADLCGPPIKRVGELGRTFDVVICGQVLEHVARPWIAAENLARLTDRYLIVVAPAAWPEHRHPIDAWRFLPDAWPILFPTLELLESGIGGLSFMYVDCFALLRKRS